MTLGAVHNLAVQSGMDQGFDAKWFMMDSTVGAFGIIGLKGTGKSGLYLLSHGKKIAVATGAELQEFMGQVSAKAMDVFAPRYKIHVPELKLWDKIPGGISNLKGLGESDPLSFINRIKPGSGMVGSVDVNNKVFFLRPTTGKQNPFIYKGLRLPLEIKPRKGSHMISHLNLEMAMDQLGGKVLPRYAGFNIIVNRNGAINFGFESGKYHQSLVGIDFEDLDFTLKKEIEDMVLRYLRKN